MIGFTPESVINFTGMRTAEDSGLYATSITNRTFATPYVSRPFLSHARSLTRAHQQRARPVEALCLAPKESRQILGRPAVERPQAKVVADPALMSSDRLPPFGVVLDRVRIRSQLKGCEPQHLAVDLEGLLVREAPEDTNKGDLVGEAQSIGDAAAAGDLLPVALKEAAIADQPGAGDVEVGGHGGLPGTNARFS